MVSDYARTLLNGFRELRSSYCSEKFSSVPVDELTSSAISPLHFETTLIRGAVGSESWLF